MVVSQNILPIAPLLFDHSQTIILGRGDTVAAYIVLSPTYSTPAYRWARTSVFITLGLGAIVPVAHGLFVSGLALLIDEIGLAWLALSGALYIAGAVT